MEFLKIYLEESRVGSSKAISYTNEKRNKEAEALLREVDGFFVITNLLWALWSMSQSVTTKITFGHLVIIWFIYKNKRKFTIFFIFSAVCRRTNAILLSLQRTLRFNFQFESMTMEFEYFQNGPFVSNSIFCFSRIDSTFVQNKLLRIFDIETTLKIEKYFVNYHSSRVQLILQH